MTVDCVEKLLPHCRLSSNKFLLSLFVRQDRDLHDSCLPDARQHRQYFSRLHLHQMAENDIVKDVFLLASILSFEPGFDLIKQSLLFKQDALRGKQIGSLDCAREQKKIDLAHRTQI